MASTNLGDQLITFSYQQEGTAQGFNKLLCGVLPEGVISGGELSKDGESDTTVLIAPMQMLIGDGNVTVHVQTREIISLSISQNKPYVVASFNWSQSKNNFVSFETKSLTDINSMNKPIILGRGVFKNSTILSSNFDYSRKTWCPSSKYNEFFYDSNKFKLSNFAITPIEPYNNQIGFVVGKGRAIINGKLVEKNEETTIILNDGNSYHNINTTINNIRIDVAVMMSDGSIHYIMGVDSINPTPPIYPSDGLVLAEFKYDESITTNYGILGNNIKNIYNNNYMKFSSHVGEYKNGSLTNIHTLYL